VGGYKVRPGGGPRVAEVTVGESALAAVWISSARADQSELSRTLSGTSAFFSKASFSDSNSEPTVEYSTNKTVLNQMRTTRM